MLLLPFYENPMVERFREGARGLRGAEYLKWVRWMHAWPILAEDREEEERLRQQVPEGWIVWGLGCFRVEHPIFSSLTTRSVKKRRPHKGKAVVHPVLFPVLKENVREAV